MAKKPHTTPATTLRAILSPEALKKMEQLKRSSQYTDQERKEFDEQKQKRRKLQEAVRWLEEKFPLCFNRQNPKPVKLHIEQEIFVVAKEVEEISNVKIRDALGFYTSRLAYQECFLTQTSRVDLEGKDVAELTDKEKEFAQERIAAIQEKINKAPKKQR